MALFSISKQVESIKSIVSGNDTFIVLPTGYGKTKMYAHLPEIYELVHQTAGTVLVISPLQSLMIDQVTKLDLLGLKATIVGECQTDKGIANHIVEGTFSIVFSSPEAALTPGHWRRCFTSGKFHDRLKAVIIDEAHYITQWGGEFRQEYRNLTQLRSIVPDNTTFVPLTATATKTMMTEICRTLDMLDTDTVKVWLSPERTNITYLRIKSKKCVKELQCLLNDLIENTIHAKKTIVYCRNIASCATLYEHFSSNINQTNRLVAMFHRSTAKTYKDHVMMEFPKNNSILRVVFATVAFGMGVDIPDIEMVVHWGAPRGLEQFAQESGRACRDGRQSESCIYFSGHEISKGNSTDDMHNFCKATECVRKVLNNYFKLDDEPISETEPLNTMCNCCCQCRVKCNCSNCFVPPCLMNESNDTRVEVDELSVRNMTDNQIHFLKLNLLDFQDGLLCDGEYSQKDFDHVIIDSIVLNSAYSMCADDVIALGLIKHELADEIVLLIEEVEKMSF